MIHPLMTAAVLSFVTLPAWAQDRLTILHTNDFHSRFEPINKYDSTCKPEDNVEGKCFGGTARLITAIQAARAASDAPVILVDGGDQFQGTLFYTYYKGQLAAEMMNLLGYDAMTVGNHEFDDGPEVLRGFVDAVEFPVLMSNADVSAEPFLADKIAKSIVIERAGMTVGLIGLTPQNTDELATPGPNVTFSDPVAAVQTEVDRLTDAGITRIIVLSHSGYGVDQHVARETTGVDVIVGGHSNTYLHPTDPDAEGSYPTMIGDTAIVQAYAYGKFLGALDVTFDKAGNVVTATGTPQLIDADVSENADVLARLTEAAAPLEAIRNKVVAETSSAIGGDRDTCRSGPCEMGIAVAEAMLERVRDQGIEIALQNGGGVRAGIDAGPVTMGEVLTVLPFQNTLSTFRVTGAEVRAALENGLSQVEEGAGRFPQVAGMSVTYDPSAAPGNRVREVTVAGVALDPDRLYGMVSNNYLRNGGDGYSVLKDARDPYDYGPDVADVLAEYLAQRIPFSPTVDDRVRTVSE
ncbi:multifunctional 2',3'-cyclic-nucleotide 2'-phosphodiesterase/5'-nucleotidase/3'-nucleotidase [Pseudohalocynthiibacter aestuariivivens]|nr:bifunctional metallophosphatase/5'-nucleotidase [Pseudohalocynthiibacter aestuariivivens]QIE45113.1 multifunctional 2',3'-cyclic-nucleotide 2'-phosphodiesterase/5'-nucleotidase/3'-nucleotidase [Pseudohalocynthiibacter aestuariivivens]